jgi:hypothetical protein
VARAAHVRGDATVGTERAATHAGCLIHLNVLDDHLVRVQTLLDGVGLGILQQRHHRHHRLARPAALRMAPLLRLSGATGLAVVAPEGDAAGLGEHLAVQLLSLAQRHTVDHIRGLKGILEVAAEVADLGLSGLRRHLWLTRVVSHVYDPTLKAHGLICNFEGGEEC